MPRFVPALTLLAALLLQLTTAGADELPDEAFFREMVAERYVAPFRKGDVDSWIEAFEDDAIAMHNRRPMDRGRAAIEAFGRAVHQYFELAEYRVEVTDIRRSGEWVYTAGSYTTRFVSRQDGSEPFGREQGKFLLLWELQDNGEWRVILDTGNSNQ